MKLYTTGRPRYLTATALSLGYREFKRIRNEEIILRRADHGRSYRIGIWQTDERRWLKEATTTKIREARATYQAFVRESSLRQRGW